MFRFLTFRRKSRRPAVPVTLPAPTPITLSIPCQNRISTLSNATTLHPSNPQSELLATLLSSFPAPPSSPFLPIQQNTDTIQQNTTTIPPTNPNPPAPQYLHTFLPNISQSSLDTLADPLGRLPNAPNRLSTFEAFINSARAAEERERYMVRMWMAAEEERRRHAGRSLSGDPWRGRFGPAAGEAVGIGLGGFGQEVRRERGRARAGEGGGGVQRERSGWKVQGAKVWLRKVTSLERLRV